MKEPQTDNSSAGWRWRVRLLDGPLLENAAGDSVRHFRSQRAGALLAYLALRLGRPCPREELYAALWPEEADLRVTANRLRVALASLRRQLEPTGIPFGTVLDVSDNGRVRLRSEAVWCDIAAVEAALKAGRSREAASLLAGDLLPGYYDEWVLTERARWERMREELEPLQRAAAVAEPLPDLPTNREADGRFPSPLPSYITRFFGREAEQERLLTLLCANRLVTIMGPGGMGKTRLAVETVRHAHLPTVWVSLAEGTTPAFVAQAILRALHVTPTVEQDLVDQIIAVLLRREPLLLLLDNAELLVETVADIAARLLRSVPDLVMLVTSRQALNVAGETMLPLGPMTTPAADTPINDLLNIPAVALFVDRARCARPDFTLAPRHAASLLDICRLLEGMPLALELAAARIVAQTPAQIATALEAGLLSLKSQQHGFAARHRSLRAAIQGSTELLSFEAQHFFATLSVFQGGWSAQAARAVTGCEQAEEMLEELSRRSLVRLHEDEVTGTMRGTFLESIRQFASEQLTDMQRENLPFRHAEYYLTLVAGVSEENVETLMPLDADQENILAALEAGFQQKPAWFWHGLCGALVYAHVRGRHRVYLPWAERALSCASEAPNVNMRTRLRFAAYTILSYVGQLSRLTTIAEDIQRDADAEHSLFAQIHAQLIHCWVFGMMRDFHAFAPLGRQTLAGARLLQDPSALHRVLRITGFLFGRYGTILAPHEPETALTYWQESERLHREFLAIAPSRSTQRPYVHNTLFTSLRAQNRAEEAYAILKEGQRIALAQENYAMLLFAFRDEADLVLAHEYWHYAALLYGAYYALKERNGYNLHPGSSSTDLPPESLLQHLPPGQYERLLQQGGKLPFALLTTFSLSHSPIFDADAWLLAPSFIPV